MALTVSDFLAEAADREAIRDCLYRYSRGVDRCDEELLRSVYWEDAFDDHCLFAGTREELIAWVLPLLRGMEATQHSISNILIRLNGDRADVESYYQGTHCLRSDGKPFHSVQAGRYLDRFERRDSEWRIAKRKVVVDWFREYEGGDWTKGPFGHPEIKPGERYPQDPSYSMLRLL
jgi:hypothetical protein